MPTTLSIPVVRGSSHGYKCTGIYTCANSRDTGIELQCDQHVSLVWPPVIEDRVDHVRSYLYCVRRSEFHFIRVPHDVISHVTPTRRPPATPQHHHNHATTTTTTPIHHTTIPYVTVTIYSHITSQATYKNIHLISISNSIASI